MLKIVAQELAQALKSPVPTMTNDKDPVAFSYKGRLNFSVLEQDRAIIFFSPLLLDVNESSENLIKSLLKWELARAREHDEIISFDPELKTLFLFKQITTVKLAEKKLIQHLEDFLNSLDFWIAAIKNFVSQDSIPSFGTIRS